MKRCTENGNKANKSFLPKMKIAALPCQLLKIKVELLSPYYKLLDNVLDTFIEANEMKGLKYCCGLIAITFI